MDKANLPTKAGRKIVQTNKAPHPPTLGAIVEVDQPYTGVQPGVHPPLVKGFFVEVDLQAQVLIRLATSIVFGLLTSTLLVLLVVPALFSVFSDFGLTSVQKEREMLGQATG